MTAVREIAWLAGLLEGEGCFCVHRAQTGGGSICIQLGMTDQDVIKKAAKLLDGKVNGPYHRSLHPEWKPLWTVIVTGMNAASWMMTLYPFLGERRRGVVRWLLSCWRLQIRRRWHSATCHPDRRHYGQGMCATCYQSKWKQDRKGK